MAMVPGACETSHAAAHVVEGFQPIHPVVDPPGRGIAPRGDGDELERSPQSRFKTTASSIWHIVTKQSMLSGRRLSNTDLRMAGAPGGNVSRARGAAHFRRGMGRRNRRRFDCARGIWECPVWVGRRDVILDWSVVTRRGSSPGFYNAPRRASCGRGDLTLSRDRERSRRKYQGGDRRDGSDGILISAAARDRP